MRATQESMRAWTTWKNNIVWIYKSLKHRGDRTDNAITEKVKDSCYQPAAQNKTPLLVPISVGIMTSFHIIPFLHRPLFIGPLGNCVEYVPLFLPSILLCHHVGPQCFSLKTVGFSLIYSSVEFLVILTKCTSQWKLLVYMEFKSWQGSLLVI